MPSPATAMLGQCLCTSLAGLEQLLGCQACAGWVVVPLPFPFCGFLQSSRTCCHRQSPARSCPLELGPPVLTRRPGGSLRIGSTSPLSPLSPGNTLPQAGQIPPPHP